MCALFASSATVREGSRVASADVHLVVWGQYMVTRQATPSKYSDAQADTLSYVVHGTANVVLEGMQASCMEMMPF